MLSTHIPSFAGGELEVTGEAIVDTQLREVQSFVAVYRGSNFVPDQESKIIVYPLSQAEPTAPAGKWVIRTEKGGAAEGLVGTNPVRVMWMALGR